MKTNIFAIVSVLSMSSIGFAQTPCDQLVARLQQDPNLKITHIDATYTCGPEFEYLGGNNPQTIDSCVVLFSNESFPNNAPDVAVMAYLDPTHQLSVHWAPVRAQTASGWNNSGHSFLGGDIKTYVLIHKQGQGLDVEVTRKTGRDNLFNPYPKTYISYKVSCQESTLQTK